MDLQLKVERFLHAKESTVGRFYISDQVKCFTLEDQKQAKKVYGETRIPAGTYELKLRTEGRFHLKYSERFKPFHVGMLHVTQVPGFEYILIHCGNTDKDTAGCLLVGKDFIKDPATNDYRLIDSTGAYTAIYKVVAPHLVKGEKAFITYVDL